MRKIILILCALFILAACNARDKEERLQKALSEQNFTTTSYNYTPYDLYSIAFKEISLPFNIDDAPSGGSIFFRDASGQTLDNGEKVAVSSGNCCLSWDRPVDKALRVRVVWSVVFDMSYHDGKSSISYDERTSRRSFPGSRWCQVFFPRQVLSGRPLCCSTSLPMARFRHGWEHSRRRRHFLPQR